MVAREGYFEVNGVRYYPRPSFHIGYILESAVKFDPGKEYGGVWEEFEIGKGRVIVGVDESDSDFNVVGKTGGEKTHQLTINEMPNHNHPICLSGSEYHDYNATYDYVLRQDYRKYAGLDLAGYRGGDQSHNNLQPYVTAYRYVRIA